MYPQKSFRLILATVVLLLPIVALAQTSGAKPTIALLPKSLELRGKNATHRLLVEKVEKGVYVGDVTANAVLVSSNPNIVKILPNGTVEAVGKGTATITATLNGAKTTSTVNILQVSQPPNVTFRNHVLPALTRNTCNSGACHGAAAGKGGLKLTLRGYDPEADYNVLTREAMGRRVSLAKPAQSLLLQKPAMEIPHGGGKRIAAFSNDYRVLRDWIRSGAPAPSEKDASLVRLQVYPPLSRLKKGDTRQILVQAVYSNGSVEDVTHWVKFGSNDNNVATVDDNGRVKMHNEGEAAITVWFSSRVTFARVMSPFGNSPKADVYAKAPRANFIDDQILTKLKDLGITPSPRSTDSEFIRRVFLDTLGVLPTVKETQDYLADKQPDKRARLIDSLMKRSEYVDYWAYKWSELFLVSSRNLNPPAMKAFYGYLRKSVEDNRSWSNITRDILTATGSNLDNGAANYYVIHKDPIVLTETTTQAFLGTSLTCARCHNHPLEKWTMRDYYSMANLFSRVRLKVGDKPNETLVLAAAEGDVLHPRLGTPLPPQPLDGESMPLTSLQDRRLQLAEWVTSPKNPYFAKSIINRVWRNFMGRGIVEAEDDLRLTNPPSNQALFDALEKDFVQSGYDLRRLKRNILVSEAYARASTPYGNNLKDDRYYARYLPRRLSAEVILDTVSQVTGIPTAFEGYPAGTRALQLPDSQVGSTFLSSFGRAIREQTCSCEKQVESNVTQALHLANGSTINSKLREKGGTLEAMLNSNATEEQVLDTVYLMALSRKPTDSERNKVLPLLKTAKAQSSDEWRSALEDLLWATLTDKEFLFNH